MKSTSIVLIALLVVGIVVVSGCIGQQAAPPAKVAAAPVSDQEISSLDTSIQDVDIASTDLIPEEFDTGVGL